MLHNNYYNSTAENKCVPTQQPPTHNIGISGIAKRPKGFRDNHFLHVSLMNASNFVYVRVPQKAGLFFTSSIQKTKVPLD